jgi:hypothetical protein
MSDDKTNNENVQVQQTPPEEVDKIFREKSEKILAEMTDILKNNGIQGYSVHSLQIETPPLPNPDICIPYIRRIPGNGWEAGCSYVRV